MKEQEDEFTWWMIFWAIVGALLVTWFIGFLDMNRECRKQMLFRKDFVLQRNERYEWFRNFPACQH